MISLFNPLIQDIGRRVAYILYLSVFVSAVHIRAEENHSNDPSNTTPLKYESGDVTIDLKLESERLKKLADENSLQLRNLYTNQNKEESWKSIQSTFAQAGTASLRGQYLESRRLYKQGLGDFDKDSKEFIKVYREYFSKYTQDLNTLIIDTKSKREEFDPNPNLVPHLERRAKEAGIFYRQAEFLTSSNRPVLALKYYMLSTVELLEGVIRAKKEIHQAQESKEAIYLDPDFLVVEDRKVWDEARNRIHTQEEESRKKERERIVELRKSKLDSSSDTKNSSQEE